MCGKVTGPSKLSMALRFALVLLLLMPICVQGWGQVVHENPSAATPSRSQPVDDQMASLLEKMMANLDDISAAVEGGNFTSARASYSTFFSSFTKYNDLMWQLNLSESDYRSIADQMNFTNDQTRAIIDEAEAYKIGSTQYDQAFASGDPANASSYAARARDSYANISSSYGGLRQNATLLGRVLMDRDLDTGHLDSSIGSLDRLMVQYNMTYRNLSIATNGPELSLNAVRSNISVGDDVIFRAVLKDVNGTPMYGGKVMVYVDGSPAGFFMADIVGEGSVRYVVPINVSGNHVLVHAEYVPSSGPIVVSNYVYLYIQDLPATLMVDLDRDNASFGDTVNVTGGLIAGGQPMPYRPIEISFNGSHIANVHTDKYGSYSYALLIGPSTPAGPYIVNAAYHQKPDDLLLNSSSSDKTLSIYARATRLTMNAPDALSPGDVAGLTGSLTTENGLPIAGANVTVYIDGAAAGTGMTDINGSYGVAVIVPQSASAGDHNIYASFSPGAGKALMESSSAPIVVSFRDSGQKLEAGGVPLMAFPGDRLDISVALLTGNGMPIPDKALNISMFGAGETAFLTGARGDFNLSYNVTGNEPAGLSSIKIVDRGTANTLYETSVLLIPYDRSIVLGAFILLIAAVAAVLLYRRYAVRKPEKAVETVETPMEPRIAPEKTTFNVEEEAERIRASMGGPDMRAATTQAYLASRKLLALMGLKLDDSMTHHEAYRAAEARFPEASRPLKYIVDLYEKAVFAGRQPDARELELAINSLREAAARLSSPEGGQ